MSGISELRLQYKFDTGNYPIKGRDSSLFNGQDGDIEYIEWLERKVEETKENAWLSFMQQLPNIPL